MEARYAGKGAEAAMSERLKLTASLMYSLAFIVWILTAVFMWGLIPLPLIYKELVKWN